MPLVAAAVCPHPPLLIPEVAAGAAGELDGLRAACDAAIGHLVANEPELVLSVGTGPEPSGAELGRPEVPLSLAVAEWLLRRRDAPAPTATRVLAANLSSAEAARQGAACVVGPQRVALLVMGDASACRTEKAPGYLDPRAAQFDADVSAALAAADPEALLGLDAELAAQLKCAGRAPWQFLAGALARDGRRWHGEVTYDEYPYGVTYLVAHLSPPSSPPSSAPESPIMNRRS